jgi:hypothetical protein
MVDQVELAKLFVEYKETQDRLEALRGTIESAVLELGESVKIAGVKATYYQESMDVDYERASLDHNASEDLISSCSTYKETTSWKKVAEIVCPDLSVYTEKKPARVVVK